MNPIRVLVLTDHSGHSVENSIYSLLIEMHSHPSCREIWVASRGLDVNQKFYYDGDENSLYGVKVDETFKYTENGDKFSDGLQLLDPAFFDLIFMRLPRPVTDTFLSSLEVIFNNAIIVNKPSGIIETSSKAYLLNYPEICPPMQLCKTIGDVKSFSKDFPIVLKPLRAYGGKGILKISGDIVDDGKEKLPFSKYFEHKDNFEPEGYLGMKYLRNVSEGDKRILVVNGEIMASSLRLPANGSWLCNVAQGGTSVPSDVTVNEFHIVQKISNDLRNKGIVIYGVDTLTDDNGKRILSEINTLSIGGFPQAQAQSGKPIIKLTIQKLFEYVSNARK